MVLRTDCRSKKRRGRIVKKVKWLGVILDDYQDFMKHWKYWIGKACSLLGALGGVGNLRLGMN